MDLHPWANLREPATLYAMRIPRPRFSLLSLIVMVNVAGVLIWANCSGRTVIDPSKGEWIPIDPSSEGPPPSWVPPFDSDPLDSSEWTTFAWEPPLDGDPPFLETVYGWPVIAYCRFNNVDLIRWTSVWFDALTGLGILVVASGVTEFFIRKLRNPPPTTPEAHP
jgi:hypothetical protein